MDDEEFMNLIRHYWNKIENITGFIGYDPIQARRLCPEVLEAYTRFRSARAEIDYLLNGGKCETL